MQSSVDQNLCTVIRNLVATVARFAMLMKFFAGSPCSIWHRRSMYEVFTPMLWRTLLRFVNCNCNHEENVEHWPG
jgi:hypothetical protein